MKVKHKLQLRAYKYDDLSVVRQFAWLTFMIGAAMVNDFFFISTESALSHTEPIQIVWCFRHLSWINLRLARSHTHTNSQQQPIAHLKSERFIMADCINNKPFNLKYSVMLIAKIFHFPPPPPRTTIQFLFLLLISRKI